MIIEYDGKKVDVSEKLFDDVWSYVEEKKRPKEQGVISCAVQKPASHDDSVMYSSKTSWSKDTKPVASVNWVGTACDSESVFSSLREEELDEILKNRKRSFRDELFRLIDRTGLSDADIYKKAEIDRRLFSKIRSDENYHPRKRTALAFAVALELNIDETTDLLKRAGYALSMSNTADLIVRYCIENGIYDILTVNAILYGYDQPLLGCTV